MLFFITDYDDGTTYNAANDNDDDDANDDVLRYEHLCCCRACGKYWSSFFFGPHTPFENIASGIKMMKRVSEGGWEVFHQRWNESRSGGIFAPLEKLQLRQAADRPAYYHFITSC